MEINYGQLLGVIFDILIGGLFFITHRKKKASPLFYILFFSCIGILGFYTLFYKQGFLILNYILGAFIYLLSHENSKYLRKSYEDHINEYQYKVTSNQLDEVENIYVTMRGWRHDYHNHMQKLKAHLALQEYDNMMEYLDTLEEDLHSIDYLIKTGNISLDAILNSKLSLFGSKEIAVTCKAVVPQNLTVSDIDLCVLIGNLLDNAMEALDSSIPNYDIDKKFLRVYIGVFKQQLYISVTNSTKETVRKLSSQYITSKRGNHGHGLKRIDLIVEKYNGFVNRKNEPGVFVTEIMLPL